MRTLKIPNCFFKNNMKSKMKIWQFEREKELGKQKAKKLKNT